MVTYKVEIQAFEQMGDKTKWNYVIVPGAVANKIKPGFRRSFRICGKIDQVPVSGMALMPYGGGDFLLALSRPLRKLLRKGVGDMLVLEFREDVDFKIEMPGDLELCLSEEQHMIDNFLKQPKSHQNYYINWINQAKTEPTRAKRIALTLKAMDSGLTFSEMMRAEKANAGR